LNPIKRIQYNSPVILTFALISLLALGIAELTDGVSTALFFSVYRSSPLDPLTYIRIFGHVIGHANMSHLFNNFMLILLVGPMLEERYGAKDLLLMMAITALVTGVLHILINDSGKLGASGIVFMMILLSSFTNLQRGKIPLTLILAMIIFVGREFLASANADASNNIAYMSHIVGGLCGAVFGFLANRDTLNSSGYDKRTY